MTEQALPSTSPCDKIKGLNSDLELDPDTIKSIASNYRTMPTFEKTLFELKFIKIYSMANNKRFACKWDEFRNREKGTERMFQFPNFRDQHFYMNTVCQKPSLSIHRKTDFKKKMNCGPGVDWRGQLPIPYEKQMKRGNEFKSSSHQKKNSKDTMDNKRKQNSKQNNGIKQKQGENKSKTS